MERVLRSFGLSTTGTRSKAQIKRSRPTGGNPHTSRWERFKLHSFEIRIFRVRVRMEERRERGPRVLDPVAYLVDIFCPENTPTRSICGLAPAFGRWPVLLQDSWLQGYIFNFQCLLKYALSELGW